MRHDRFRSRRGAALLVVLLVVLVLSIVGLGVAYFTRLEDQTSGNIRLAKSAFYAAETGLRTGERALTNANALAVTVKELLDMGGTTFPLPGGGDAGIPLNVRGTTFDRIVLPQATGTTDVATFTLYIRNNIEDPGRVRVPPIDEDNILNLVAVGQLWTVASGSGPTAVPGRLLATKILEEQIRLTAPGESFADQEGANQSGTNTGQIGG